MKLRSYCHTWCTWMLSLPCESSHKTLPVGDSLVFLQVTRLWEALLSHFLHCFSPVWSLMFHQFTWSTETHVWLRAPIVFNCRSTLIILSVIWWREAIVTFGTLECLLSCVSPLMKAVGSLMFLQVIWPWEPLGTLWAQKLFLSCVVFPFFFHSPDPVKLMSDFVYHSFSTVGVLLLLFKSFDE